MAQSIMDNTLFFYLFLGGGINYPDNLPICRVWVYDPQYAPGLPFFDEDKGRAGFCVYGLGSGV